MERINKGGRPGYTIAEAAEILQFHPDALNYWLRTGELIGERDQTGGDWLIRPEAIVAFLRQNNEILPAALTQMTAAAVPTASLAGHPA